MVFKYLMCVEGKAYKRGLCETNEGKKEVDFFAWFIDMVAWLTSQTIYISLFSHGWPGSSKWCLGKEGRCLGSPHMMSFCLVIIIYSVL